MIEAHNLTKIYTTSGILPFRTKPKQTVAVRDLNLRIETGQIFGLVGVNGAGKTTIIKMLCTLLEPTSGRATVGGHDVMRDANRVKGIVNMIAGGERMLYWRLTGKENLSYFADLYNINGDVKRKRIEELLDLVGLKEHADVRVEQYSKGMKQRLQIARGLINDPHYIFMDEPTIGLDAPIARELRNVIKTKLNKTIFFTSHYLDEVEELCDVIAIIHKGQIVEQGTVLELKRRYKKGTTLMVTVDGKTDTIDQVLKSFCEVHKGSVSTSVVEEGYQLRIHTPDNVTRELVDVLARANQRLLELRAVEPSLEDILITILGKEA